MSTVKNYGYNMLYQLVILLSPFIVLPYLSRIIGADGTGIYSYTHTIAEYFVLFAMLGMKNYGVRQVSKVRDNKMELSKTFWNLYFMQIITSLISLVIYILLIIILKTEYTNILLVFIIYVFSSVVDIFWLFEGLEKFKVVALKNVIIKVLTIVAVFAFVKTKNDICIYALIISLGTLIGNLIIWRYVKKEVDWYRPEFKEMKKHIKPNVILFVSVIAASIYKKMDKLMIKLLSNITQLGYYEFVEKINYAQLVIATGLGTVMLPKMSHLKCTQNNEKFNKLILESMEFVMFLAIGLTFGIIAVSGEFIPIYLGNEFETTIMLLRIMVISGLFVSWANIIRTTYLLPNGYDSIYVISVIIGAVINFVLNMLLISRYGALGAVIATVITEIIISVYQTLKIRKEINVIALLKGVIKFFPAAFVMVVVISLINNVCNNKVIELLIKIIVGGSIYLLINYRYVSSTFKRVLKSIK